MRSQNYSINYSRYVVDKEVTDTTHTSKSSRALLAYSTVFFLTFKYLYACLMNRKEKTTECDGNRERVALCSFITIRKELLTYETSSKSDENHQERCENSLHRPSRFNNCSRVSPLL